MNKPILDIIINIIIDCTTIPYNQLRYIYLSILNHSEYTEYFEHLNKHGLLYITEDRFNFVYYKLRLTKNLTGIDIIK